MTVQDHRPRQSLSTSAAPRRVIILAFAATSFLAASFYISAHARMAAIPTLPAPANSTVTLLVRLSAIAIVVAGFSVVGDPCAKLRPSYYGSLAALSGLVVVSEKLLWNGVPWTSFKAIATSTLVLVVGPRVWRLLNDRQLATALSPLILLCAASIATELLQHQYLFPWYDRWGLVAALIAAVAAAADELPLSARVFLGALALASVVLSTSRQAFVAISLVAAVMLWRAPGVAPKVRSLAITAVAIVGVYSSIGASQRLQALGGISSANGRYQLWASAWSYLSRSPILGLGGAKPTHDLNLSLQDVGLGWSDSAHNFVLDSWLRGGALAAVAAVVFAVIVTWPSGSRAKTVGVTLVPFFLFGSQVLFFGDPSASLLLALTYGVAVARSTQRAAVGVTSARPSATSAAHASLQTETWALGR